MIMFVLGVLCSVVALVFVVLYKTYQQMPGKELKRLARRGDAVAALLYKPVAYGLNLQILLTLCGLAFAAVGLALLVRAAGPWLAVILLVVIYGVGILVLLPSGDLTRVSLWMARQAAPGIAWILERLNPLFDACARLVRRVRPIHIHTGLYEKSDLVELLTNQKSQPDNRIPAAEIDLLSHALTFGDKLVSDAMVPKRIVRFVAADDSVGPVLMGELHASGHSRFPVYEEKQDNIVGILYLRDLVASKKTGKARELMSNRLTYVHEDFTLFQTLQAFLKTKQHLFLVVNSFEEFVGIITVEDIVEQVIGRPIVDEFDHYEDLRAVAAAAAHQEHTEHKKNKQEPPTEPEATPETPEVV